MSEFDTAIASVLATLPSGPVDDVLTVAAAVACMDEAEDTATLRQIGRHIACESLSEDDLRMLRRVWGWRHQKLALAEKKDQQEIWRGCLFKAAYQGRTLRWAAAQFKQRVGRPAIWTRLLYCPEDGSSDWDRPPQEVFRWIGKAMRRKQA